MKIVLFVLFFIAGCATQPERSVPQSVKNETIVLDHKYFTIAYDQNRRLARYVVYQLTDENLKKKVASRKNKFIPDYLLMEKGISYVNPDEYTHSGYDRGHLAPAADFAWSQEASDRSFVMSNMAPQSPALNRSAWKKLEDKVRKWACGEKRITVITGPILKEGLPKLPSGLVIPEEYFKMVIDETPPTKIISFIYNQNDKGNVLESKMVSLDKIQQSTGLVINQEFPQVKNEMLRVPASLNSWTEANCN